MSERLGPVALGHKEELVFLGREIGEQKNYSEKVAEAIDEEIRMLIDEGYAEAVRIIRREVARCWTTSLARSSRSRRSMARTSSACSTALPPLEPGTPETPPPLPEGRARAAADAAGSTLVAWRRFQHHLIRVISASLQAGGKKYRFAAWSKRNGRRPAQDDGHDQAWRTARLSPS